MMQLLDNLKLELIGVTLLRQPNCPHCQRGLESNRQQAENVVRSQYEEEEEKPLLDPQIKATLFDRLPN